jgi:hypothetical protein
MVHGGKVTEPLRWPENAENARMDSLTNARRIREIIRNITKISREIEVVKSLFDAMEYTYMIENQLISVGPKAEKEQRSMGY